MRYVFVLFFAACANVPANVTPACRGDYDSCVGQCSQNPVNRAQPSDGRGMPVHSSEERNFNSDVNASDCLSLCRSSARQCSDERREIRSPPASMPASH